MKILFISGNLTDGGAQRVISVVSSELAEKGHDVSLLLFARNEKEYPISEKVKLTALCQSFADYQKMSLFSRVCAVRRYLKKNKPEVAVGFLEGGYALYLASFGMRGIKKVASARIDPKVIMQEKGIRGTINRAWFRHADAVVLQTPAQAEHVDERMRVRSVVIANPISEHALEMKKKEHAPTCRRIVMAGRLAHQKNYPMVFRAVAALQNDYPNLCVDIFGKGGAEERLNTQIKEMGLDRQVRLCGWSQDTVGEYAKADAYILSSNYEGMPNALMEAMAVGLPCISTDCETGPRDLVTDGENGFLVPVNDDAALAARIRKILDMSAEERAAMGDRAHEKMKNEFSRERIADKWEQLFCSMTEGK